MTKKTCISASEKPAAMSSSETGAGRGHAAVRKSLVILESSSSGPVGAEAKPLQQAPPLISQFFAGVSELNSNQLLSHYRRDYMFPLC